VATKVNADNIQGDILAGGFPKKVETFIFFRITDAKDFIDDLKQLAPLIKTVKQILKDRDDIKKHKEGGKGGLLEMVGVNIALSYTGLHAIGISDEKMAGTSLSADGGIFKNGAVKDAPALNDPMDGDKPKWDKEFLEQIDGVILVAGDSDKTTKKKIQEVTKVFGHGNNSSIHIVRSIDGSVRPGDQNGHEHFGFQDGISNPLVIGFDPVVPGPAPIDAKFTLTGYNTSPPDWTADGSFLVFRYLLQHVPEFNSYLKEHAIRKDPLTGGELSVDQGVELLGARFFGRWKSGAPVDVSPFRDDPKLAKDPNRNNDFSYTGELRDGHKCPWAAHVRRTNPRADSTRFGPNALDIRKIVRHGITFGPEVTAEEKAHGKTKLERGLLFACYQSNINDGFRFQQKSWSNNPTFPFIGGDAAPTTVPGLDPIIGQGSPAAPRTMTGYDPNTANDPEQKPLTPPDFVITRGAGYFFSPSIKTLKDIDKLVTHH